MHTLKAAGSQLQPAVLQHNCSVRKYRISSRTQSHATTLPIRHPLSAQHCRCSTSCNSGGLVCIHECINACMHTAKASLQHAATRGKSATMPRTGNRPHGLDVEKQGFDPVDHPGALIDSQVPVLRPQCGPHLCRVEEIAQGLRQAKDTPVVTCKHSHITGLPDHREVDVVTAVHIKNTSAHNSTTARAGVGCSVKCASGKRVSWARGGLYRKSMQHATSLVHVGDQSSAVRRSSKTMVKHVATLSVRPRAMFTASHTPPPPPAAGRPPHR